MLMKKSCLFAVASVTLLSGCADRMENPYLADILTRPESVNIYQQSPQQVVKVSYLARDLMEDDNRAAIRHEVAQSERYTHWSALNAASAGVIAQMGTDLVVGQAFSSAGSDVGLATFGAGLVLGEMFDGSEDYASHAWLPATYRGRSLSDEASAEQALRQLSEQQVKRVADIMGWQWRCLVGCEPDSKHTYYYLTNPDGHALHADYIYKPTDVVIGVSLTNLHTVSAKDPMHALLGEPLGWQTQGHNSYRISVLGDVFLDHSGQPKIEHNEQGEPVFRFRYYLQKTHIGRDILRTFHSTPYTFQGDSDDYPHLIYYRNDIYRFSSNSDTYIARNQVTERYLLDGKAPVTTAPELQTPLASTLLVSPGTQ